MREKGRGKQGGEGGGGHRRRKEKIDFGKIMKRKGDGVA